MYDILLNPQDKAHKLVKIQSSPNLIGGFPNFFGGRALEIVAGDIPNIIEIGEDPFYLYLNI